MCLFLIEDVGKRQSSLCIRLCRDAEQKKHMSWDLPHDMLTFPFAASSSLLHTTCLSCLANVLPVD